MSDESISNSGANSLGNYAVVFVSRQIPRNGSVYYPEGGSMPGVQPYSRFQVAAPGKLIIREANGTLRTLIDGSKPTPASLNLIDVNAPDVSYDGTKIVFAGLPQGSYSSRPMDGPGAWRIYVINVDGSGLRQVTFSDRNIDLSQFGNVAENFTAYDDTDPVWLPDGRIVFSSTRWPSFGQYGAALTSNLYVVNADGTGLHRITAERNGAERPVIDPLTGKIVYSRWWRNFRLGTDNMATIPYTDGGYVMKDGVCALKFQNAECQEAGGSTNLERNAWHLATINPDGTGLAQFAGQSNSFVVGELVNHAYGGAFAPDGSFYANFFPMTNGTEAAGFGGIRLYRRGANGYIPIIGITTRDESVQQFVRSDPGSTSYGVYVGNYAADPEVLPDGRLLISLAQDTNQDYGLYIINPNDLQSKPILVYDNPGTTELRARLVRARPLPPIIPDRVTRIASALPPTAQGPYDIDGTFTFNALNVYFNAPVDAKIINAPPVGSAKTIRFFIDHQRDQQTGSFETLDWPILLKEVPVNPDGSVSTSAPANVPLFEQLRTSQSAGYKIPLTGPGLTPGETGGAAHVAGMNFGRTGEVATCVGCHAGHTMIPVPANPADAQWTNLAPGATVTVSSTSNGSPNGINDRRLRMDLPYENSQKFWISNSGNLTAQWVKLTFPVPVTVRIVRLYNIPSTDSSIRILNTTVKLYSDEAGTVQVASKTSGALSENGTDVVFNNVLARAVRIEFTSANGSTAALGEVEVIARGEGHVGDNTTFADVPFSYWAWQYIETLYALNITTGCGTNPLIYCPSGLVTRAQMAIFLLRSKYGSSYVPPSATGTVFNDVTTSTPGAAWIEQLAREGITSGCGGGNYCPNNSVTRAQMAIFLLRAKYGDSYTPPPATGTMFSDVTLSTAGAAWIEQLAREGITSGCGGGRFCPGSPVTRAEMAVFLVRTFNLLP
ncbi:MAG TPA: S-layer homology domain-containing protein [Anaerolineales bacterium]|nr:S-layer homology domain-containing protein [Anaerolineales bacterium]